MANSQFIHSVAEFSALASLTDKDPRVRGVEPPAVPSYQLSRQRGIASCYWPSMSGLGKNACRKDEFIRHNRLVSFSSPSKTAEIDLEKEHRFPDVAPIGNAVCWLNVLTFSQEQLLQVTVAVTAEQAFS